MEVTLLGQNVNAYGKELEGEISFAEQYTPEMWKKFLKK